MEIFDDPREDNTSGPEAKPEAREGVECSASSRTEGWRCAGLLRTHVSRESAFELCRLEQCSSHLTIRLDQLRTW